MTSISAVFHPLLMATYTSLVFYWIYPSVFSPIPYQAILHFVGAIFVTTFLIPALSILLLKLSKRITSLELTRREERILPFFSISCFYGATAYIFNQKLQIYSPIVTMLMISTILIVALGVISLKYKISIHAAASWGLAGLFCATAQTHLTHDVMPVLFASLMVAGITSASRLYLNRHQPGEVWSGSILGFLFCYLSVLVFI